MSDADSFFSSTSGFASAQFKQIGDSVTGFVFYEPEVRQARDFDTGQPAVWPDGNPKMQMIVVLMTDLAGEQGEDDMGHRTLYIPQSSNMARAVGEAIHKAGAKKLEIGGKLRVKYEGDGTPPRKGFHAPKVFSALYRVPEKPKADDEFFEDNAPKESPSNGSSTRRPVAAASRPPITEVDPDEIPF